MKSASLPAEIDEDEDQHHRHELRDQTPAHVLVGALGVLHPFLAKGRDAANEDGRRHQAARRHEPEKRVGQHGPSLRSNRACRASRTARGQSERKNPGPRSVPRHSALGNHPVERAGGQDAAQRAHQVGGRRDVIARPRARRFERVDEPLRHRRGRQFEPVLAVVAVEPRAQPVAILGGAVRVLPVDPPLERRARILADLRRHRPRLDQADVDAGTAHLDPQRIRQPLDGELGADIGPAPADRHQPKHRGILHDPAIPLRPHRRDRPPREVVPAEYIGLEYLAQRAARQILDQRGAGIGAVVEQRIQSPARGVQHLRQPAFDARLVGIVDARALESLLAQPRAIGLLAAGGKDAPATGTHPARRVQPDARRTAGDEKAPLAHDHLVARRRARCKRRWPCPRFTPARAVCITTSMTDLLDDPNMRPEATSEPLRRAIGERYLTYALSTIMHRALPDARDGLKPVHRRILYAMRELRLSSTGGFRKSAKISGDVMGNYHPHGDQAIYDAIARLAQDFAVRYPLVDGQGNFGNIDGDNPAASRYTEARMTAIAEALMDGLDENAVDFRENYDGTTTEPEVLPAAVPNLLANGSSGIAVGMATNIPPHNLDELVAACLHLIKTPDARDETLLNYIKGPDFPTGGVIVEPPESMAETYRTGRGAFRLRARWEIEDQGRGTWQIVITEIPYQVQKSKLIEKLAELIQLKKVPILADVRDESADDIRIVLEPRSKNVDADVLMNMLYRNSDLETRFSLNMNVLIDGLTPKVCSLKEVLRAFLDHRRDVLIRRSRHRMAKIDHRLEVLEGFIVAFLNLDRVIDIIRYDDDPKPALMREDWGRDHPRAMTEADYVPPAPSDDNSLTEVQVDAILNMRLRSLRR